uniref:Uncharacterized protein n=1 Tax=Anguilla anguilla TaxID=7936 RepID=A0A0E9QNG4_ANGAN
MISCYFLPLPHTISIFIYLIVLFGFIGGENVICMCLP